MVILVSALVFSLLFSILLGYMLLNIRSSENNPNGSWTRTFSFWWGPEEQNITSGNGILWMNFTFKTEGENLSITVKVNDDEGNGSLIMVFDKNKNGKIDFWETDYGHPEIHGIGDTPYEFDSDNKTMTPWIMVGPKGQSAFASVGRYSSPWHTCTFNNETGFTFNINLPLEEVGSTGMVYAIFGDPDNPYISFSPLTYKYNPPESTIVYVYFSYLP
jgi:hypothetical protein